MTESFEKIKTTEEYMSDIDGKYKYCIEYLPVQSGRIIANMLRVYLYKYVENVPMEIIKDLHHDYDEDDDEISKNKIIYKLPSFEYKNIKATYKDIQFTVSNINLTKVTADHDPGYKKQLVLAFNKKVNINSFILKDADKFYKDFVLKDNKAGRVDIYTWDDGYWEKDKSNYERNIETLFLNTDTHDNLMSKISKFQEPKTRKIYERLGLPYKLNLLLYGPPGTGKSSFIEIIASQYKKTIRYMHVTPKIKDTDFSKAICRLGGKDILVCEDIDCLFVDRKKNDKDKNGMTFSGLLNCFDGITGGKNGLMIFMTTNYKCNLDSALMRPGRIDLMEEFTYMNKNTLENMIRFYFQNNFNMDDFNKFAKYIEELNVTGAILSNFLLDLLLNDDYNLIKNKKKFNKLIKENDYEKGSRVTSQLYS